MKILKIFFIIIIILIAIACSKSNGNESINIIAHAGGAINGIPMTNSREALFSARDKGYKFIEFDLLFTADSMLVACHSWEEYNASIGEQEKGNSAPTLEEFLSRRLPENFTPLTATEINDFFQAHDSLYFVTDKVSDVRILNKFFPLLKKRMVVEAFNYKDYTELQEQGYAHVAYSCMADDIDIAPIKHLLFHWLFPGEKIECVALHTSALNYNYLKILHTLTKFRIALFTVNNLEEVPQKYINDISFLYTDYLLPTVADSLREKLSK